MKIYGNENNQMILKELGQRVKDTRVAMALTQKDLALKSGVSDKTIERVEKGENVKMEIYLNILRAINSLENIELLITEQDVSPSMIYNKQQKRKRSSLKQKEKNKTEWKWGDEE